LPIFFAPASPASSKYFISFSASSFARPPISDRVLSILLLNPDVSTKLANFFNASEFLAIRETILPIFSVVLATAVHGKTFIAAFSTKLLAAENGEPVKYEIAASRATSIAVSTICIALP